MARPKSYTLRPISALATLLTFVPLTILVALSLAFVSRPVDAIVAGSVVFLFYRLLIVRLVICGAHRKGVVHTRSGDFEEAIAQFDRSKAFFARHPRVDRFRAILLGSAGPYSLYTLARYNKAYCLSRLQRGNEALAIVDELLKEDPHNTLASGLRDILTARSPEPATLDHPDRF